MRPGRNKFSGVLDIATQTSDGDLDHTKDYLRSVRGQMPREGGCYRLFDVARRLEINVTIIQGEDQERAGRQQSCGTESVMAA